MVQGRAVLLHAFDAQGPEELSAYRGEEVRRRACCRSALPPCVSTRQPAGLPRSGAWLGLARPFRPVQPAQRPASILPRRLKPGPQVEVEAEVDGWLHCVNVRGQKGLLPASYLRFLGPGEAPTPRSARRAPSQDFFSMVRPSPGASTAARPQQQRAAPRVGPTAELRKQTCSGACQCMPADRPACGAGGPPGSVHQAGGACGQRLDHLWQRRGPERLQRAAVCRRLPGR